VQSLSQLTGKHLQWQTDMGPLIQRKATHGYTLHDGPETVATGQVTWERLKNFDFVMQSGEGIYQVHIDLRDPGKRPAVAWRLGDPASAAGFQLWSEGSFTVSGWITTASGRQLVMQPTSDPGIEYVVFPPDGAVLFSVAAAVRIAIGGNPGHMFIAPEESADSELPALVALSFAVACEQFLRLHWDAPAALPRL
jgi:hypothetical protein